MKKKTQNCWDCVYHKNQWCKKIRHFITNGYAGIMHARNCSHFRDSLKIVFVYDAPHYFHKDLADSVGAVGVQYAGGHSGGLISSQLNALRTTVPDADIYLVESARCLLPIIKRKLLGSKAKVVCINSDTLFYDYPRYWWSVRELISFYLGFVDCFISTSKYVKELAQKYTKIPHIVVNPYCDYERYSKVKPDLKDPGISTIGNVCHFRGSDLLLDAFMKLEKKNPNMGLRFIGRYAEKQKIIEDNDALGISNDFYSDLYYDGTLAPGQREINVTGRVEYPDNYLGMYGNYINCARHDSFGINVLEAMSAGFAPIVSENVGAKEVLPKELICKTNVNSIVKKYYWLNKDIKRKKRLGKLCQRIAKKYTKERSIKQFKEAFWRVIKSKSI